MGDPRTPVEGFTRTPVEGFTRTPVEGFTLADFSIFSWVPLYQSRDPISPTAIHRALD